MKLDKKTAGIAVAAAGLVGTGLYIAVPAGAAPRGTPAAATASQDPAREHSADPRWRDKHPRRHLRGLRGVHGEATVRRDGAFGIAAWQRGTVTAVSANALTVRSADGTTWQWTAGGDTRVRKDGEKAALSKVAVNDQVRVVGRRDGTVRTARAVIVPKRR